MLQNSLDYDKIIFHHLTKTAGTALINELKQAGINSYDNARYDFEWKNDEFSKEDNIFFHGHYTFDKISEVISNSKEKKIFLFTFIRNPIDRVISQFFNWKNQKKTTLEAKVIASRNDNEKYFEESEIFAKEISKMNLMDFLQSDHPKIIDSKFNHQTRYLSESIERNKNISAAYQNAKFNLANYYNFIGLKEAYNSSCRFLEKKLSLPTKIIDTNNKVNLNASKSFNEKYQITKRELDLLIENNLYDIKLFEFTCGLFIASNNLQKKPNFEKFFKSIESGYQLKPDSV